MDDRLDIQGSAGTCHGDMMQQSSLFTYSDVGYGYSVEKGTTTGYSFTIAEEYYNYGMPQEMQHFTDCVLNDTRAHGDGRRRTRVARGHLRGIPFCRHGQENRFPARTHCRGSGGASLPCLEAGDQPSGKLGSDWRGATSSGLVRRHRAAGSRILSTPRSCDRDKGRAAGGRSPRPRASAPHCITPSSFRRLTGP